MDERPLMTADEINAFGVEIVTKQLEKDGWAIEYADGLADIRSEPQIAANKDGEQAFFVVRTAIYPARGRFDEGTATFERLVRHAKAHGASCYFASVGIANGEGTTEEEMSVPVKGAGYNIEFDGLIKMELPPAETDGNSNSVSNGTAK
jgi:hypothetical protein